MKAKCPDCKNGCHKRKKGFVEVGFAEGNMFTRQCSNKKCLLSNGIYITPDKKPKIESGKCVFCKGKTKWLLIGINKE